MNRKQAAMDTIRSMVDRGPRTLAELAKETGLDAGEVNSLITASGLPYRLVNGIWSRKDGQKRGRQKGEPLLRHVVTNGIGGCHAL